MEGINRQIGGMRRWKWAVLALSLSTLSASGVNECGEDEPDPHHPPLYYASLHCGSAGGTFVTAARAEFELSCDQVKDTYPQVRWLAGPMDKPADTVVTGTYYRHSQDTALSRITVRLKIAGGNGADTISLGNAGTEFYRLLFPFGCKINTPCI